MKDNGSAEDDGFVSVLMLSLLALAALMCMATADAANVILTRARVQQAADAAALAAAGAQRRETAGEPAEIAAEIARRNGGRLESCDCDRHRERAVVVVSARTRVRMLGVAPPEVRAEAAASVDVAALFRPPR